MNIPFLSPTVEAAEDLAKAAIETVTAPITAPSSIDVAAMPAAVGKLAGIVEELLGRYKATREDLVKVGELNLRLAAGLRELDERLASAELNSSQASESLAGVEHLPERLELIEQALAVHDTALAGLPHLRTAVDHHETALGALRDRNQALEHDVSTVFGDLARIRTAQEEAYRVAHSPPTLSSPAKDPAGSL